jgi:hypothetical protein
MTVIQLASSQLTNDAMYCPVLFHHVRDPDGCSWSFEQYLPHAVPLQVILDVRLYDLVAAHIICYK